MGKSQPLAIVGDGDQLGGKNAQAIVATPSLVHCAASYIGREHQQRARFRVKSDLV
jgi:hypothetical protein